MDRDSPRPARATADASVDRLVGHAQELADLRHPGTAAAWERVVATGADLPPDVAARAARFTAARQLTTDPAAAHEAMLGVAARFAALGDRERELEARATAAHAAALAGQAGDTRLDGWGLINSVLGEAAAAFADGQMTPRFFLNVVMIGHLIRLQDLGGVADRPPADVERLASGLESALALAERHGDTFHVGQCHDLLSLTASWDGDDDAYIRHLTAAREAFLTDNMPWFAAQAEMTLANHALRAGDPQAAEALATDALTHGSDVTPQQRAMATSMLATALRQLPDRTTDYADASLTAARAWDGISEPDIVYNTLNAARAYASLGQHIEAVTLFAQAIPQAAAVSDHPVGLAQTRQAFGHSLRETHRHREAAEQFLEAARLIADDPNSAKPHAFLTADAARDLQLSGQADASLETFRRAAELFGALEMTQLEQMLKSRTEGQLSPQ